MLPDLEPRIVAAVEAIGPSIAAVEGFRPGRNLGPPFVRQSQATAVVIDRSGFLVTNQHVVEGTTRLAVRLADGREYPAEVIGGDAVTDVALVRIEARDLPVARIGDSSALRVGQIVLAVGNALGLPGGPAASMGIVSALGRPLPGADFIFEGLIQTDAAINPGNSGGPLVDLTGSVVGINAATIPMAQGVAFAIPIHAVVRITDELRSRGRVVRPWVGVNVAEIGTDLAHQNGLEPHSGLLVAEVVPRSPAHRAGLTPGDVITRVGPFEVRSIRSLLESLSNFPVGSDIEVAFRRRGNPASANVSLQELPAPEAAAQ
jgi:serine protease Do